MSGKRTPERKKREFSKVITTAVVVTFSLVAVGFIVFVCYEMHRQEDLSPVAYIGTGIVALLAAVLKFYMDRAAKKSETDLKWEETKRLTLFKEKHPDHFTQGTLPVDDVTITTEEGNG